MSETTATERGANEKEQKSKEIKKPKNELDNVRTSAQLTTIEEELVIGPKTIIITESKISMPKDKEDPNNLLNKVYRRSDLDKTLLFTLNKLIRKIEFYYTFVKNEFLTGKDNINDYKFLLCLFYNNIPVSDINDIVKRDLDLLIKNGYIKEITFDRYGE